jgi:hypothetical protein
MSNLSRAVSLLVILHLRVPLSTSLVATRLRCHKLQPMMAVSLACMPWVHISQGWEKVQSIEVLTSLSLQTSSRPSLGKPFGIHVLQPQTLRVGASCLHNSLDFMAFKFS